jgi:hypothetical protein
MIRCAGPMSFRLVWIQQKIIAGQIKLLLKLTVSALFIPLLMLQNHTISGVNIVA